MQCFPYPPQSSKPKMFPYLKQPTRVVIHRSPLLSVHQPHRLARPPFVGDDGDDEDDGDDGDSPPAPEARLSSPEGL